MLVAETVLLKTIRDTLRSSMSLRVSQCDVELDGELPNIAEEFYISVFGAGVSPGPRHLSSGGVWDINIAARVVVYMRCSHVARDRKTDLFLDVQTGLNAKIDSVIRLIDFSYPLANAAIAALVGTSAEGGEFMPFRKFVPDNGFRPVASSPYDAADMAGFPASEVIGIQRGVTFQDARFMSERV